MQLTQQLNTTIITWRRVPTSPDVLDLMIMMKNEQEGVGEVKREEKDAPRFLCWFISLNLPHKHEHLYNLYFVHSLELQFVSGPCVRVSCGPATRPPSQFAEQPTSWEKFQWDDARLKNFDQRKKIFRKSGARDATGSSWVSQAYCGESNYKMPVSANIAPGIQSIHLYICAIKRVCEIAFLNFHLLNIFSFLWMKWKVNHVQMLDIKIN